CAFGGRRAAARKEPIQRMAWTYTDALDELWRRSNYERGYISNPFGSPEQAEIGRWRVRALMAALGDPQRGPAVLHVAGSKGKGSTVAMVDAVLRASGRRTGRFTSPHLHSFRERIAIDDEPATEAAFAALAAEATEAAERLEREEPDLGRVSTFELLTAMGFLAFAEAACDAAVIEVGLGGLYDATNVVEPLVSVITRIDLEHTAVLGDSLAAIAAQKAGVIKPARPVAVAPQVDEAAAVFVETAGRLGSPLLLGGRDWRIEGEAASFRASGPWGDYVDLRLGLPGTYQMENAGTAIAALWLADRAGLPIAEAAIRTGLAAARWPGRFERAVADGVEIVLDGAHTPAAATALAASLVAAYPGRRAQIILGISKDKDAAALARALAPVAASFVATRSANPRAADAMAVEQAIAAADLGIPTARAEPTAAALAVALADARREEQPLVVAAGSLFVVADAREALGLGAPEPFGPAVGSSPSIR
ncbi:MAG TPA: cyanophycin synthetase, partial [Thermomicrobiales bacterium]|nr:cyanophycin synthetase [Thermomicrobiales bacterium]